MSLALVLISVSAQAVDPSPRVLREPVFGLRYERAQTIFEPLPPQVLAKCSTLADNQHSRAVWYVYGKTGDASGRTFYVIGGYEERLDSHSADRRFITDGLGWLLLTDASTCDPLNPPRDVFNERLYDDALTPSILQRLAVDVVNRLERAFGGPERLRTELRNQRVDTERLPPELRIAMRAYLSR